jgi:tetratricopeptide (TPR) repeat protein
MNVEAGLLDFLHIEQANSAYQKQDYEAAAEKFSDIDNDAAHLNQANSLYKQGLYEQALEQYQSVKDKELLNFLPSFLFLSFLPFFLLFLLFCCCRFFFPFFFCFLSVS